MFTSDTSRHRKGDTRMTHYVITKKLHLHLTGFLFTPVTHRVNTKVLLQYVISAPASL